MPYRQAAEDEEAKRDAAEISAFAATVDSSRRRNVLRVLAIGLVIGGAVAAAIYTINSRRRPSTTFRPCGPIFVDGEEIERSNCDGVSLHFQAPRK